MQKEDERAVDCMINLDQNDDFEQTRIFLQVVHFQAAACLVWQLSYRSMIFEIQSASFRDLFVLGYFAVVQVAVAEANLAVEVEIFSIG